MIGTALETEEGLGVKYGHDGKGIIGDDEAEKNCALYSLCEIFTSC